jgi:hypothetical protein
MKLEEIKREMDKPCCFCGNRIGQHKPLTERDYQVIGTLTDDWKKSPVGGILRQVMAYLGCKPTPDKMRN